MLIDKDNQEYIHIYFRKILLTANILFSNFQYKLKQKHYLTTL